MLHTYVYIHVFSGGIKDKFGQLIGCVEANWYPTDAPRSLGDVPERLIPRAK